MTLVLHLSTSHTFWQTRFRKIAETTAKVNPVVMMGVGSSPDGLNCISLPYYPSLWRRLLFVHPLVLWHCLRIRPRLVHFHTPEALPIALFLRLFFGTKIVYDVYENLVVKLNARTTHSGYFYRFFFTFFDKLARKYAYLIFAEDGYLPHYQNLAKPYAVIHNFCEVEKFVPSQADTIPRIGYIGQLSIARCFDVLILAVCILKEEYPDLVIEIFGGFGFDLHSLDEAARLPRFAEAAPHLHLHGSVPLADALPVLATCRAGLAMLRPVGDYPQSYPTKIFEYMALELPVVTSNFPLYKSVVETHQAGFCIDPASPEALAERIAWLIDNPEEAKTLGKNGRSAAEKHYNWANESHRLLAFYEKVLNDK